MIIVSNSESWAGRQTGPATALMQQWAVFRKRNPTAKLVCLDLQPVATSQALERADVMNIGGFSDAVFEVIAAFADGTLQADHWAGVIDELDRASQKLGRKVSMNREARQAFLKFAQSPDAIWQGNFRDLNAVMIRMATLSEKGRITEALVISGTALLQRHWNSSPGPPVPGQRMLLLSWQNYWARTARRGLTPSIWCPSPMSSAPAAAPATWQKPDGGCFQ